MDNIEDKRANAELAMLEQACKEMQGLTDIVLHELGAQIHSHVSAMLLHDVYLIVSLDSC